MSVMVSELKDPSTYRLPLSIFPDGIQAGLGAWLPSNLISNLWAMGIVHVIRSVLTVVLLSAHMFHGPVSFATDRRAVGLLNSPAKRH